MRRIRDDVRWEVSGTPSRLRLEVTEARIDWLLAGTRAGEGDERMLLEIGTPESALDSFLSVVSRWLTSGLAPTAQRIALGAVLLSPVENRAEGYRDLGSLLNAVKIDPENSTDFLYQINRPRPSHEIEGLGINRLSKWAVAVMSELVVAVNPVGTLVSETPESFAVVGEFDINTQPKPELVLAPQEMGSLVSEFRHAILELAADGDKP